MHLSYYCPRCGTSQRTADLNSQSQLVCGNCAWTKALPEESVGTSNACVCCGNTDLWRQKDFPQWLGMTCVAAAAILSSIAWYYYYPVLALGILMAFALADWVLYALMGDVLVCYRCQARHHAADVQPHAGYNHETGERYRQERLRLEADQRRQRPEDNPSTATPT